MVDTVTVFRTSDGKLFDNILDATEHEREHALDKALEEFWERYGHRGMDRLDAQLVCVNYAPELYNILKDFYYPHLNTSATVRHTGKEQPLPQSGNGNLRA